MAKKQKRKSLLNRAQKVANLYARRRDCGDGGGASCISCGKWFSFEELDGGHFIPKTSSAIRFDERNINAQCRKCNRFLHGNGRHYLRGMLRKYGETAVHDLESKEFETHKWTEDELKEIIVYYEEKIKNVRNDKGDSGVEVLDLLEDIREAD